MSHMRTQNKLNFCQCFQCNYSYSSKFIGTVYEINQMDVITVIDCSSQFNQPTHHKNRLIPTRITQRQKSYRYWHPGISISWLVINKKCHHEIKTDFAAQRSFSCRFLMFIFPPGQKLGHRKSVPELYYRYPYCKLILKQDIGNFMHRNG